MHRAEDFMGGEERTGEKQVRGGINEKG